jgi:hypothetical protein
MLLTQLVGKIKHVPCSLNVSDGSCGEKLNTSPVE